MPDYSLGKIYKIVGNGKVYVGSTTRPLLCQRMSHHRCDFKRWKTGQNNYITSFMCLEDPECYIELLEACPCNSKDELERFERKWVEALDCVNKKTPRNTDKEYRDKHKEQHAIQNKKWRNDNIEHFKHQQREYRARKKLLASNNGLPVDPTNLLIKVQPQEANLVVEHKEE